MSGMPVGSCNVNRSLHQSCAASQVLASRSQHHWSLPSGARLAFGGKELEQHSIPEAYGAMEPTAVVVPLDQILASDAHWELATTELFGPFQVPLALHSIEC